MTAEQIASYLGPLFSVVVVCLIAVLSNWIHNKLNRGGKETVSFTIQLGKTPVKYRNQPGMLYDMAKTHCPKQISKKR